MSLLEGFSDYVMDEVGHELVPGRRADPGQVRRAAGEADPVRAGDAPADRHGPQARAVQEGRDVRAGDRRRARARGARPSCGMGPRRCRETGRSRRPSAGSRGCSTAHRRQSPARHRDDRGPGQRARRRPDGDRPEPDPVGPLPVARPRADPRGGPGCAACDGLGRRARRRPARRRRGHAPRLAELGRLRPAARPGAPARLGPLGDIGRGTGADAGRARARPHRHERPRCVQPADRRVRADDDPRRQPAAAPAPGAAARADVAAARGHGAARRDRRHRRTRLDRSGGRCARDGVRLPGRGGPPPARRGWRRSRRSDGDEPSRSAS